MTFADEPISKNGLEAEEQGNYPTAFGITFTPQVSGIALAILGVLGAVYILANFVMPAYQNYQTLTTDEKAKEDQVNQQKSGVIEKKLQETETKLKQAQNLKSEVLNLFSSQATLDTLLIDINKFVASKNAKLVNYKPQGNEATIVNDGSLGTLVNNKLKRQTINLELEGTFEQTQSILRDIERLQPLLLVKNISSKMTVSPFVVLPNPKTKQTELISLPSMLKTTLTLDVVLPLTPEEAAAVAQPPAQEGQQQQKS
ncbi:MAG: pilus assembly protein [Hydrococcus sp. C42_A2020_068]|nr:pilus assembly protein [Hydrococcus sp. C42_A2020_068]